MKINLKKRIILVLSGAICLSMAACRNQKEEALSQKAEAEFVYVPSYKEISLDCDYIDFSKSNGEQLFFSGISWDEGTDTRQSILYRYDLLTNSCEPIALDLEENDHMQSMDFDSDGNLLLIVNRIGKEEDETESGLRLYRISEADGTLLETIALQNIFDHPENTDTQAMAVDDQDNIYISDGQNMLSVLDRKGVKLFSVTVNTWISNLFQSGDGKVYISVYGSGGFETKSVDLQAKSLGAALAGSKTIHSSGASTIYKGMEASLLVDEGTGVFTYDLETDTRVDLFNWLDADINHGDVQCMGKLSDGRIWAMLCERNGEEINYSMVYLTKTNAAEVVQKEEIIYGTRWLEENVRKTIIHFNKTNDKYRIKVREYTTDEVMTDLEKFNADISGKNCPDLIDLSFLNFKQLAARDILEDLNPYMERDGIQKEDYIENVLEAYEADDKLYGIVPQFFVITHFIKTSRVGDLKGWTLTEMMDIAEKSNAKEVFQSQDRESVFYNCIYNNIDEFINWETGECSFVGENFLKALEFTGQFPEEQVMDYEEGIVERLRSGSLLTASSSVNSVAEYQMMRELFGEEITAVGYPNSERKGNVIQSTGCCLAISSRSAHKEGAWEFIKEVLSDEYQSSLNNGFGFPLKKSALEEQFQEDMKQEYEPDENGDLVESVKLNYGYDSVSFEIYAANQEEVNAVRDIITSAERLNGSANEAVYNIISEEAGAFFAGQKSAEETAKIIQSRIEIYVKENK